ncbi:addiction module toxin RelE [Candidatus Woesearchaeota archaeon]|nr:addiction module toxin RelE [Candidatus Woesearchaeota archaeon]
MRNFLIEDKLKKIIEKLHKKNPVVYEALMKKIEEILNCEDVEHYKNLHSPLQEYKRVHVGSSFILLFKYVKTEELVVFYDLDHHDNAYN